jgi:hypothetical protein
VSLCLASKRLRDVAQQVLHHEFVLGYGDSWRSASSSWDRRLTSFLRTVGRRPDLAVVVRRVSLHPKLLEAAELGDAVGVVELRRMGRGLGLEIPDESRPPRYQGRHGELKQPPVIERWRPDLRPSRCAYRLGPRGRELRMRYVDAYTSADSFRERHALGLEILAILIGTLPSVERLSVEQTVVDYETPYLSALRSVAMKSRPRLLKTLDIATHDYMLETMLQVPSQAAGILELSKDTLQTLNLHMCNGFWTNPEHAPTFRSLKTLRLINSRLSAVELGVLLSCCTGGLTSFTYEAARSFHRPGNTSEFHPPEAIESLRVHVRTLRTLHLDLRQVVTDARVQPMLQASLVDFTALENIFLSVNMLWVEGSRGVTGEVVASPQLPQLLPANTTSLSIAGRHRFNNLQQLSARLLGLARAVAEEGKLSRLRHVRCDSKFNRGLDDGLGPDICGIFQGAGVEFGLGCWPPSQTTITSKDVPSPLGRGTDNLMLEDFDIEEYSREEAERSTGG